MKIWVTRTDLVPDTERFRGTLPSLLLLVPPTSIPPCPSFACFLELDWKHVCRLYLGRSCLIARCAAVMSSAHNGRSMATRCSTAQDDTYVHTDAITIIRVPMFPVL